MKENNMMRPLISVIVPVYKVEDVLARCLDSLCRQSLQNIEILLVDDASPDRCGAICEAYAEKDPRFRVIHHSENRGLSAARNTGIAQASADYLMFVDSDDWVHEDFCKLPYECAVQNNAELVMFGRISVDRHGSVTDGSVTDLKNTADKISGRVTHLEALDLLFTKVGNTAWNKLYKKRIFDTISYPDGLLYEDIGTTYKAVLLADSVYFLDKVLYFQCYHEGSITTLRTKKALRDRFAMFMRQYHDLAAWGYPQVKLELRLQNSALSYCIRKKADMADPDYVFCRKTLQGVKGIPKNFTWKRKVLFVLLKYCPPAFDLVCNLRGKRWNIVE